MGGGFSNGEIHTHTHLSSGVTAIWSNLLLVCFKLQALEHSLSSKGSNPCPSLTLTT